MVRRPRRLVVPIIGLTEPERLLEAVCALAEGDDAVIAVVVIEISPLLPLDARMDEEEAAARALLARARAVAEAYGVHFVPRVVRARESAAAILALAEEQDADLVVVGSGGHRLRRPERQLVRKASGPVLVV
jgi:nucleotide-binding universal stress UspA family protein